MRRGLSADRGECYLDGSYTTVQATLETLICSPCSRCKKPQKTFGGERHDRSLLFKRPV